jgi:hypothetical protein
MTMQKATPSPTLPARGRVSADAFGMIVPHFLSCTSPLAGETGRGVSDV